MNDKMELKPCPFCGGEDIHVGWTDFDSGVIFVECEDCGMYCEPKDCYANEPQAVKAWNTRADDYQQAAEYWKRMYEEAFAERTCHEVMIDKFFRGCSECGYMWEYMYGIGKRERPNYCSNCGARVVSE